MKRFFLVLAVLVFFTLVGVVGTITYMGRATAYRFRDLKMIETTRDSDGQLAIRFTPPPEMATRPALASFELADKRIRVTLHRRAVFADKWTLFRGLTSDGRNFESIPRYDAASQSYVTLAPPFHGADAPYVYLDETGEHPFR